MLAELPQAEQKKVMQRAMTTVKNKSLLNVATLMATLMAENAKLLAEVNRLRVLNGEQPVTEYKL